MGVGLSRRRQLVIPIGVRTKAACCHLAVFTLIGIFSIPYMTSWIKDEEPDFSQSHRYGALVYQVFGVVVFVVGLGVAGLPGFFLGNAFDAGVAVTFFWILYICSLGLYLLGAFALALQAWSGKNFHLAPFNRWVYDEE